MIDLRPITHYLGLCIIRNLEIGTMSLIPKTYISKLLERFKIKDVKEIDTFMTKKDIFVYVDPSYCTNPSTVT